MMLRPAISCCSSVLRNRTWTVNTSTGMSVWNLTRVRLSGLSSCTKRSSLLNRLKQQFRLTPLSAGKTSKTKTLGLTFKLGCGVGTLLAVHVLKHRGEHVQCKVRTTGRLITDQSGDQPTFQWNEFIHYLWPELWHLLLALLSAFAVAMVNIKMPLLIGELVEVVSKFTKENAGNYLEEMKKPAMKLISMYAIQAVLTFGYISMLSSVGERLATRMRKELFASLVKQDIAFFDVKKTGELVSRLTADVQDFKSSFKLCISQGLRSSTQVVGCIVSIYMLSPKLTALMVVIVPAMVLGGTVIGRILRSLSRQAQEQVAKATSVADEALGNIRTVRAFAMETKECELYGNELEKASSDNMKLGLGIGFFQGVSNFALNGLVLCVLYAGGYLVSSREIKGGDLMSFLVAVQTIQRSLASMSLLFGQAVRGVSAGARVFEYILMEPQMNVTGGKIIPYHSLFANVEFHNVSFSYPTRPEQSVLKNFNLKLQNGQIVALCGSSGGGKSTIAALLERFYDVNGGRITLDGHDIRSLDASWLRGHVIGFINQEPVLFATTVKENIRYGRPNASDEEVYEAAKLANANDFIREFPEGYDTVLGERGVTVSGGQKQRIAIARALIKNPSILVLDEATSALDTESERVVQEALDRVIKGRTVLVIAHRLSTIQNADVIAVISNGTIVEMGTHEELKRKNGIYTELIKQQSTDKK
ncbi:mitochondrial potassium channel ATP-binding subunit-like [Glandiceps talaboti]